MKTIAFFNNKGGVGKTSLVYHLAWMFSQMGKRVIVADLDPQANVSSMFLGEEVLANFMDVKTTDSKTVDGNIAPLLDGVGGINKNPHIEEIEGSRIGLLIGDISLSRREGDISSSWSGCLDGNQKDFRITTLLAQMIADACKNHNADLALVDMGPNLGAINRAALIASDHVIIPLAPDLFSLQGIKNVGPALIEWRNAWNKRKKEKPPALDMQLPDGGMHPLGYVIMRHAIRLYRPVKSYQKWIDKIPAEYRTSVLKQDITSSSKIPDFERDEYMLAHLKDYRSLMPIAQEANKPIFMLKPGDGAMGAHMHAVNECHADFEILGEKILTKLEE